MDAIFNTLNNGYITYKKNYIPVIFDTDDNIWFHAKQTAINLGYTKLKQAIKINVADKHKMKLKDIELSNPQKMHPHTLFISEQGLYSLLIRSRKKAAKQFVDWVTEDVLPSIRKYGSYRLQQKT